MNSKVHITRSIVYTPPTIPKLPRSQAVHAHTDFLHSKHLPEQACMNSKQKKEGEEKELERDEGKKLPS